MELAIIILGLLALACFYEYKHLSNNNIRHDENIYAVIGFICLLAIIIIICMYPNLFNNKQEILGE